MPGDPCSRHERQGKRLCHAEQRTDCRRIPDRAVYFSLPADLPGKDPAEITEIVHKEISTIIREGISEYEMEKARKQARAMFAYSCENITNQAYWLGYSSMFAAPSWYTNYMKNLEKVTIEDVSRIAEKYFQPANCLTGIYSK